MSAWPEPDADNVCAVHAGYFQHGGLRCEANAWYKSPLLRDVAPNSLRSCSGWCGEAGFACSGIGTPFPSLPRQRCRFAMRCGGPGPEAEAWR